MAAERPIEANRQCPATTQIKSETDRIFHTSPEIAMIQIQNSSLTVDSRVHNCIKWSTICSESGIVPCG